MATFSLWPPLPALALLVAVFSTARASIANVTIFYDNACNSPGQNLWPLLNQGGNCTSLLTSDSFASIKATYLAQGCTISFYSDLSCTNNATEAQLNDCGSIHTPGDSSSAKILSFSIDECKSSVPDDWASPTASASVVLLGPSPTSSASNHNGDTLTVGSEIGSIIGSVCGLPALVTMIEFGRNQWKRRQRRTSIPNVQEKIIPKLVLEGQPTSLTQTTVPASDSDGSEQTTPTEKSRDPKANGIDPYDESHR